MAIKKRRIAAQDAVELGGAAGGEAPADAFGHDVQVLEYDLVGAQFTVDAVVARLKSEGVQIVRSSPFYLNVQAGGIARLGEHKIVFKADDKVAVGQALRDAGMRGCGDALSSAAMLKSQAGASTAMPVAAAAWAKRWS